MSERWIEKANLPENRVTEVVMSDYKPIFKRELESMGILVKVPKRIDSVQGSEAYHADMSVCHLGGTEVFYANELDEKVTAERPLLNLCIFGENVLCHTKKAYQPILAVLRERKKNILHTNQSYAKCSTAVVGENAVITADAGICKICGMNDIDVLKISQGDILLDGYAYGFIGGCCGLIDKDTLVFSGNVKLHRDYENIKAFARNYHVELVSLGNEKLYDIGGILPLKELKNVEK